MLDVLSWLGDFEQVGLSKWLRETQSVVLGFYFVLAFHTIGLSLVVGPSAAISFRFLGIAPEIPVAPMTRWFRLIWLGLALNVASGVLLVYAYPVKSLSNPTFYVKLALIGVACWTMLRIKREVLDDSSLSESAMVAKGKTLAVWALVLWASIIGAGRLLAYTCSYLLFGVPC